jgi:DNA-binding LacI/PurR family transcriptional regulator
MAVDRGGDAVRAPRPVTVLVLTPCIGGHFFGELVAGLSREVARAGGHIVLVQTLDGGELQAIDAALRLTLGID